MPRIITDTAAAAARMGLPALGLGSLAVWVYVALAMPTSNRPAHVGLFLGVFAILFALYLAAAAALRRGRFDRRRLLPTILAFAVAFRLVAVLAGLPTERPLAHLAADVTGQRVAFEPFLLYDNDLWRYLWDGHALAEGVNPYRVTPLAALENEELAARLLAIESWRDVHGAVSFRNYGTIYPPLIHYFFAALAKVAPASAGAAKLALAAVDLLLCLLLVHVLSAIGARRELVLIYAWNPAVIKELSASGHPDGLMMLTLVAGVYLLARGRMTGGVLMALSVLAKLASLVTLPLLAAWSSVRRGPRSMTRAALAGAGVLILGLWPLAGGVAAWLDALDVFSERWTFNSGPWASLRWLLEALGIAGPERLAHLATRLGIAGAAVGIAIETARRTTADSDPSTELVTLFRGVFFTLAALVLLSPAVMPWYVLWALPAAVIAGNRTWPVFTGLALLSYLNYADGIGAALWWKWLEYGALAALVGWEAWRTHRRPSPAR